MILKTSRVVVLMLLMLTSTIALYAQQYQPNAKELRSVNDFISKNWHGTIEFNPTDNGNLFGLPKPYNVPSVKGEKMFKELYYWDTYFTNVGLLKDNEFEQAKNNVDNILFMVKRFGKMLNGSNKVYLNRSQPPYLSMMVADIYRKSNDKKWLAEAVALLKVEYKFWMTERLTPVGLNRYSNAATTEDKIGMAKYLMTRFNDPNLLNGLSEKEIIVLGSHYTAEAESGWDFNPRFLNRCEDFVPIDLNSNLYIYEKNFAWFSKELQQNSEIQKWEKRAEKRKELINKYCYDKDENMFYDYDFVNAKQSNVTSSAIFSLMYANIATPLQAKGIVKVLPKLETNYGLRTCEKKEYTKVYQWGETNGWAPIHFIGIEGLKNYGFRVEAKRITNNYVATIYNNFIKTNNLWEKYNIVDGTVNTSNEYQMPAFLGWTAGVFLHLIK